MIDVDSLLQPISPDAPAGRNLRLDPSDLTFRRIAELRSELDAREDPEGRGRSADWPGVVRECQLALAKQSKDLELAALLAEGLTRVDGLRGLRVGLELMRRLIEQFWEHLHPGVELRGGPVDAAVRAPALARLGSGGPFLACVKQCTLASVDGRRFSWSDSEVAERLQDAAMVASGGRYRELAKQGALTPQALRAALQLAPPSEIAQSLALLGACAGEMQALAARCAEKFGVEAQPSLSQLESLLGDIRDGLVELTRPAEAPPSREQRADSGATALPSPGGALGSRAAALEQLRAVAAYFRAAEPHSPIASLVERAVKWGHMPFEQVLRDVVKSPDALARVWETLGVEPPSDPASDGPSKKSDGW